MISLATILQTVSSVVVPTTNQPDAQVLAPFFFTGIGVVLFQKWLKAKASYIAFVKAFPGADKYAHWVVAGIASIIGAAGIHITWNWTPSNGGTFVAQIPPLLALLEGIYHLGVDWLKLYATQHWMYLASHQPPYSQEPK